MNGNALSLGKGYILAPKHCFPWENGKIIFGKIEIVAQAILDGVCHPKNFKVDYRILFSEELTTASCPKLSVSAPLGQSLQIGYLPDRNQYVLPYESQETVSRSDVGNVVTTDGDSGAVKVSINFQAIHSIHQGQS